MPTDLRPNNTPAASAGELTAGRLLYWSATIIAGLMVVFAVGDFFIGWAQGAPTIRIVAFMAAVAVWLIGYIGRLLLP